MKTYDWNETARGLAGFVQKFRFLVQRGVVPLQVETEEPVRRDEFPLLFGVFGEEAGLEHQEAESIRQQLQEDPGLHELGFGVSGDGSTWAMLIGADQTRYHTEAGRALQRELLKVFLEDAVNRAAILEAVPLSE